MTRAATSMFVFAIYLTGLGLGLLIAPNFFLRTLVGTETTEVWIRAFGMLLLFLAYFGFRSARSEMTEYIRLTVHTRAVVPLFFGVFVLFGNAPPILMLFGAIDLAAAIWTAASLRLDERSPARLRVGSA